MRSRRALAISEKQEDLDSVPALDHAFGELQRETHQYATLSPEDVAEAIDLSKSIVEQMLRLVPEEARGEQVARVCAKLTFLRDVLFVGVNGFPRGSPEFNALVEKCEAPTRNPNAVHLELGTYTTWPDAEVDKYIDAAGIGDFIRLDMNTEFRPDVAANVAALPFADESIDRVSSNSLFEHVAYPHEVIREAFRVLRPGGVLITCVPFHFVRHGCPNDYLRYTPEFFDRVCTDAGFTIVASDSYACSGVYYTLHQFLKGCTAGVSGHPSDRASQFAHIMVTALFGALQGFDDFFVGGGASHHQATRAFAVKPGEYQPPSKKPNRELPFIDRYDELICPASGLPLRRGGDSLVSLDGTHRYEVIEGIPNLFTVQGFGWSFRHPASSRRQLEIWQAERNPTLTPRRKPKWLAWSRAI